MLKKLLSFFSTTGSLSYTVQLSSTEVIEGSLTFDGKYKESKARRLVELTVAELLHPNETIDSIQISKVALN